MPARRFAAWLAAAALAAGCGTGTTPAPTALQRPAADRFRAEEAALKHMENDFTVKAERHESLPDRPVASLHLSTRSDKLTDKEQQDDRLEALAAFPHLRELQLTSIRISGAGFKHLAGLNELRRLDLSSSEVDDAGLKTLPVLPNLESIDLGATNTTSAGIAELRKQPKLRELAVSNRNIQLQGLRKLAEFPALARLETGGEEFGDDELAAIARVARLEHLAFWAHDRVTVRGLGELAACKSLSSLRLELRRIDPVGLARLRALPLTHLGLRGAGVTDAVAAEAAGWSQLRHLTIGSSKSLTDEGLESLSQLTNLESLGLPDTPGITDAGMAHVGKLTNLRNLNLGGAPVGDRGVAHLAPLTRLRTLDLSVERKPGLTSEGLRRLAGMTELEQLDLFNAGVTDDDVDFLARFKKLKRIKLFSTQVTAAGAERLRKALPEAKVEW